MKPLYEYRIRRVRRSCAADVTRINSPETAADVFRTFTVGESRELFLVASLNIRNECTGIEIVAVGGAAGVDVHPREVFRSALLAHAYAIIVAHNHPSNDPTPSAEDIALTHRLVESGKLLGIPVLDHIVVGDNGYRSICEYQGGELL